MKRRSFVRGAVVVMSAAGALGALLVPHAHAHTKCVGSDAVNGNEVCVTVTDAGSVILPGLSVEFGDWTTPTADDALGYVDDSCPAPVVDGPITVCEPSEPSLPPVPSTFTVWLEHGSLDGEPSPSVTVTYVVAGGPAGTPPITLPAVLPPGRTCVMFFGPADAKPSDCLTYVSSAPLP